jgi:hypothetical protein
VVIGSAVADIDIASAVAVPKMRPGIRTRTPFRLVMGPVLGSKTPRTRSRGEKAGEPIHELEPTVQVSASARAAQKCRIVRVAFDRIALFLPQGNHRIDERGAARRNETCQGCDRRQNQRYSGDSREVVGAKTVEQRGQ